MHRKSRWSRKSSRSLSPRSSKKRSSSRNRSPILKPRGICLFEKKYSYCQNEFCPFQHGMSKITCNKWVKGKCLHGNHCAFKHDPNEGWEYKEFIREPESQYPIKTEFYTDDEKWTIESTPAIQQQIIQQTPEVMQQIPIIQESPVVQESPVMQESQESPIKIMQEIPITEPIQTNELSQIIEFLIMKHDKIKQLASILGMK